NPANLLNGWSHPMAETDFGGPYATLALAAGAGWLAFILYVDAFISPAGTGLVYVATSSRLTYALGRENLLPSLLGKLNGRGVPFWSILLTFVVGEISFLPFPSWQSLVTVATQATAVMYAFAPVSLTALRRRNPERPRPYRMRAASVFAPAGFVFANLIVYWTGFDVLWKLLAAIAVGVVLFTVTRMVNRSTAAVPLNLRQARWIAPWLLGIGVISYLGRYGDPGGDNLSVLPEWLDLAVVIAFSLAIFYWAVNCAMDSAEVRAAVEREELELAVAPEVNLA
ncbi:MAG: APC family permease, partial [Kutzneria sp.]|nr:APC family permease [Kutzneria sp.]